MRIVHRCVHAGVFFMLILLLAACGPNPKPSEKDIVEVPEQLDNRIAKDIKVVLDYAGENRGLVPDSAFISHDSVIRAVYIESKYLPHWSVNGQWKHHADSLMNFLANCKYYGLFPSDYHFVQLKTIRQRVQHDSIEMKNAMTWTKADVLLTDAFLKICQHISRGRIPYDSLTSRKDSLISNDMYLALFRQFVQSPEMNAVVARLEPKHTQYHALKVGLRNFLDSARLEEKTVLPYPFKDSLKFYSLLSTRLKELSLLDDSMPGEDTSTIYTALRRFQASKKIRSNSVINQATIDSLNESDLQRFKRIALSLDRIKQLADTLPPIYVWVNIPSYSMKVVDHDTVVLWSRTIVGTPKTRTPELNSEITNFVIYPQWTVPYSIVFKEMVPQIRKDVNYLTRQNLMIVDLNDNLVDPLTIDWNKADKNNFPYQVRQRQGDDNSLGVLKFNFRNRYSVYLHDTNARWLFSKSERALSHGCVRVQKWKNLATYLVRNDTVRYPIDSLDRWLSIREKKTVSGFGKVPVYIRYYTCEGNNGSVTFYPDIYAEDKVLLQKYFNAKSLN